MPPNEPLHEVWVIFGHEIIDQYCSGEYSTEALKDLGPIKKYSFETIPELNAFIRGVELAQGWEEVICVDDLLP